MWEKYEHEVEIFLVLIRGLVMKPCLPAIDRVKRVVMLLCSLKYIKKKKVSTVSNAPLELYLVSQRNRSNYVSFADEQVDISTS